MRRALLWLALDAPGVVWRALGSPPGWYVSWVRLVAPLLVRPVNNVQKAKTQCIAGTGSSVQDPTEKESNHGIPKV